MQPTFMDPDTHYLVGKTGIEAKFTAEMLRRYGPCVVNEALRCSVDRFLPSRAYFVGICSRIAGV